MKKNAGQIIRRYASALFEASLEAKEVEQVSKQAEGLSKVFTPELVSFFVNPAVESAKKKAFVSEIFAPGGASQSICRFFDLLIDNGRVLFVSEIFKEFVSLSDQCLGIARVNLFTSNELSAQETSEFTVALEKTLNKKIIVTHKIDPALKAGCIVKIGNTVIDASLQARLQSIKESLSQGV